MFFKGSGGARSGGVGARGCGPSHYPVTGSRVSILQMQISPSSLNISNAIYSKEIHQSTALIKRQPLNLVAWKEGVGEGALHPPHAAFPRSQTRGHCASRVHLECTVQHM